MLKLTVSFGKKCLFFHKWEKIKTCGPTKYFVCKKCNARKVEQEDTGVYYNIDWDWLNFSKKEIN